MKIAIIGAGAMGSLYGGKLAAAQQEPVLFDINEEHIRAVKTQGLDIEELASGIHEICHPRASTNPEDVRSADVFIIFVKSTATEAVARQFREYARSDSIAVTLQNGLGNEKILRRAFGAGRTAAGVTSQGATFVGPGRIRHAGTGPTYLCMSDKKNHRLAALVDLLTQAGFETHIEENIEDLVWSKLIINVGINALTALTGLYNGQLLDTDDIRTLMADLVDEAVQVARAKGITLTYADPQQAVKEVAQKTARNRSSMLQDFDRHKRSEIDFINGAIVREAEALNIPVPVNRAVTRLVRTLDAKLASPAETCHTIE
jgi:2-dehydropantoate 2-reductase